MKEYSFEAVAEDGRTRLDVFLAARCAAEAPGFSRTFLQELIAAGNVKVDGAVVTRCNQKLKSGQSVRMSVPDKPAALLMPEDIPLTVVYEDDDVAVINKPQGLVVHPAPGNREHTLVNALLMRFKNLSSINPGRPGIVHRLDKETSGLMVIAKNNAAHLSLAEQFAQHTIRKIYVALVRGSVRFDESVIDASIGRHPHKRESMAVESENRGRFAQTRYRTLKRSLEASLVELEPLTGRTHQLRVHMAYLGHPILGDTKYGQHNTFTRMALHARLLGFTHPSTGKFLEFKTPIPEEFEKYINKKT